MSEENNPLPEGQNLDSGSTQVPPSASYDEDSIQQLEGLEAVR